LFSFDVFQTKCPASPLNEATYTIADISALDQGTTNNESFLITRRFIGQIQAFRSKSLQQIIDFSNVFTVQSHISGQDGVHNGFTKVHVFRTLGGIDKLVFGNDLEQGHGVKAFQYRTIIVQYGQWITCVNLNG
jgi:hypothetical protein